MTVRHTAVLFVGLISIETFILRECIASRWKRIVGGKDAETHEFPYQVSLRYYDVYICGGALISSGHVLSAAHCVCGLFDEPYDELTVVVGSNNLREGGEIHTVQNVHCHPDYIYGDENSWVDDVVVIEVVCERNTWFMITGISIPACNRDLLDISGFYIQLSRNINISESQSPIRLPTSDTPAEVSAVLSGWGRFTQHSFLAKNLQKVSVTVLDNADCQKFYRNTILSSQMCTLKKKGVGACKGDSGSPLVYNGELIGIFSWTVPCANGSPDVYSRIYYFLDFIKSAMSTDINNNSREN